MVHEHTLFLHYPLVNNLVVIKLMQKLKQQLKNKKIELINFINFFDPNKNFAWI